MTIEFIEYMCTVGMHWTAGKQNHRPYEDIVTCQIWTDERPSG